MDLTYLINLNVKRIREWNSSVIVLHENTLREFKFVRHYQSTRFQIPSKLSQESRLLDFLPQSGCWMLQAARQTKKIRLLFFKSILRQNIGFFDVNNAGELNTRIAE